MANIRSGSGSGRMPALFVGHGSPMNAIEDNIWSRGYRVLAELIPRPKAILSISAHWFVPGTYLTGDENPKTIHDFSGFPKELHQIQYPAPGDVTLARQVAELLGDERVALKTDWGIDHGTWAVLHHMYPDASIPVVQLSVNSKIKPAEHLAIGRKLAPLRDEGVLIMGSGNITHNLRYAMLHYQNEDLSTPDWANKFDADIARSSELHDGDFLVKALDSDNGRMSHPTPDHYFPLLYVVGASHKNESIRFPITGFDLGSLSMRSVLFG